MLVVDLPAPDGREDDRTVVLGPAIPESWSPGQVKGLRLRGGGSVDFQWDENGLVTGAHTTDRTMGVRIVNGEGKVLVQM